MAAERVSGSGVVFQLERTWSKKMKVLFKTQSRVAIASAVIVATSVALPMSAGARPYRHAFQGAYGYAPGNPVRTYGADHYYRRFREGGYRVDNNLNPDFQLGGDR
jgi:hypothetical protein